MIPNSIRAAVSIPKRINRSSIDLLKALSDTVRPDANSPLYKFLDDPFTIPLNNSEKRNAVLAKASGVKAARMMINKYPQAFFKNECEPHVPAFFPDKTFREEEMLNAGEDLIYSLVDWGRFLDAFNVYLKCKDEKITVSEDCKRALFEVLSMHNSNNMPEQKPVEEEFYNRSTLGLEAKNMKSTWKQNSEAELLFAELKEKNAAAYCSLIKGMLLRFEIKKAFEMYESMVKEGMLPDIETYNALLKYIVNRQENTRDADIFDVIMAMLQTMSKNGVQANLRTFNNALRGLSKIARFKQSPIVSLKLLKEMKLLGIEPCLATYNHILNIFYSNRNIGQNTEILPQVITEVEKLCSEEKLEWRDESDGEFFANAMLKCNLYQEVELGKRLFDVAIRGANRKFLADNFEEMKFFDRYLKLLLQSDAPDSAIEQFFFVTPNIWSPPATFYEEMARYISHNEFYNYIPVFWSDLIATNIMGFMNQSSLESLVETLLRSICKHNMRSEEPSNLHKQLAEVVRGILMKFPIDPVESESTRDSIRWTGDLLSMAVSTMLSVDDFLTAWSNYSLYFKMSGKIVGELSEKCLVDLFNSCMKLGEIEKALNVTELSGNMLHNSCVKLVAELNESVVLTQEQKVLLKKIESDCAKITKRNLLKIV